MRSASLFKKKQREVAAALFVEAAEKVIAEKGCAVGTLYLHFKNKEDLFNEMVTGHCHAITAEVTRASADAAKPLEQLRLRIVAMMRYFNEHREFFRIFYASGIAGRALVGSNLRGSALRTYNEAKQLETELVRKAQSAGDLRTDIPAEDMIEFLHGVVTTTLARWSVADKVPPQPQQVRLIWELVCGGMGAADGKP